MLQELLSATSTKVAAAVFTAVATVGTGAAAATGNLPDGLQSQAADAVDGLGIELPDPDGDAEDAERQDDGNRQDDGQGQDDVTSQDGEGTDTDELFKTLTGDENTTPEDGEEFGEAVSDNASDNGEDFGTSVGTTASDGESDQGTTPNDTSTTGDDEAAEESSASEGDYPGDAPADDSAEESSTSGDEYRDSGSSNADENPSGEHTE